MKKLILFTFISLLIIPILAKAQWYYCDSPLSPFKNCQVVSNFTPTEIAAGDITCSEISFYNKALLTFPLVVRVNYTSENYEIWRNDFSGYGWVYSETGGYNKSLICEQPESKTFLAEEYQVPNNTLYCYNSEDLFIIKPKSDNLVHICLKPNIALKPATFEFTEELLSVLGPIWAEPKNVTYALNNTTGYTTIPLANLEIFTNFTEPVEIDALLYSDIFVKNLPNERPFGIFYLDIKTNATNEQIEKGIKIRIYYDENWLKARGLDENNIRIYRFDENSGNWIEISSIVNAANNYIESAWLKHFSLYGIFTSFYYPPSQIVYTGGGTTYYITNVTNVTNVTQVVEKPIVKETVKEVPTKAVCGNGICEVGESCSLCPEDCKCTSGYECLEGVCLPKPICGNGICERGEDSTNCPEDCAKPIGITGQIISVVVNPVFASLLTLAIIVVAIIIFRRKSRKYEK
jgi:hypothetical protein